MNISERIAIAVAESSLPFHRCKACQRQGLPILPLRRALVPDTRFGSDPTTQTRLGLRTLRSGYLYVLLDQRVWQAFEVTEHGHLRRFDPYAPPLGPPPPLPETCVHENHDIPSAFLTLDAVTYGSAWIAFASDPWPMSVLNAYKSGQAPASRFEGIDLSQARDNPALLGLAMTPEQLQVDRQVFEYAQQLSGPFDSAHGFHSRFLRKAALRGYLTNAIAEHQLHNGVLALVLDDSLGLAQEYNQQRLKWVVQRQAWRDDPLRAYQLQTSQILQIIRATQRQWAAQQVPNFEAQAGDGPPIFANPAAERQRQVEIKQRQQDERLDARYDEPRRAAFQADYDRQEARLQAHIDEHASHYAQVCESAAFRLIERYDYDGRDRESGIAYSTTLAACLAGGITEAPSPDAPRPGSSAALWRNWLQDPHSPPYRALLLRDKALLAGLLPSFSTSGALDWNDSEKLYSAASKLIASEDLGSALRGALKQAITDLQGAVNGASLRLHTHLAPGVHQAVRHLNSVNQLIYNGVHLIELQVQMKLGEYYALQSAHLRELQNSASVKLAKLREQVMPDLDDVRAGIFKPVGRVKPIIQTGLLSLAVLDPKIAHQMISVSVWVEGKGHEVRERLVSELKHSAGQFNEAAKAALVEIKVAAGTLEPQARQALQRMQISAGQVSQMVKGSFEGLRTTGKGWELLLSVGGIYFLGDSLRSNLKALDQQIGPKREEALFAVLGASIGLLGGVIELGGLTWGPDKKANSTLSRGRPIARIGALTVVSAGVFESMQALTAAHRSAQAADHEASKFYRRAAVASTLNLITGTISVFFPYALGPVAISIALTITAYYLMKQGSQNESSPLERWVRRCHFGRADEVPPIHWDRPDHADIAFAELNTATIGLAGRIRFEVSIANSPIVSKIGVPMGLMNRHSLRFEVTLPSFNVSKSGYSWVLSSNKKDIADNTVQPDSEIIAYGNHQPPTLTPQHVATEQRPRKVYGQDLEHASSSLQLKIVNHSAQGLSIRTIIGKLHVTPNSNLSDPVSSTTLTIRYWVDREFSGAYAVFRIEEFWP
ncbi:T6SS effector BTH_I2691 family protein [Pseudomonas sp.]|uniref:T6SS effector BTH_I2691 family protein n=2 Tax=unclassified Pseudomonas TaxID=196821 RepID=UPI0028AE79B9|nr:T6SS effector BTH_I2691 family protein [Pseudomonas sp.]